MDFKHKGAFDYVTGPSQTYPPGVCPAPTSSGLQLSSDATACGDSDTQYKRSYGLGGEAGLFATKHSLATKTLLKTKKGKSKSITGKATVDCKLPSSFYSNPVIIRGSLKYTLTFKRSS
jgi:hypothetical protein